MKATQKKGFIVVAVLLAVVTLVVTMVVIARKKAKAKESTNTVPLTPENIDASVFPLGFGTEGEYVALLQRYLVAKGANLSRYGIDGKLGGETTAAMQTVFGKTTLTAAEFKALYTDQVFLNILKTL
jgi:peptidoglycan hydrolase-like protein with peptidoglycan-binding domain